MSTSLRTTKHLIKWVWRSNWCHDAPLFYIGVRRMSASLPWQNSSHIVLKRAALFSHQEIIQRHYAADSKLPTHKKVPLPALSPTMERGSIVSWEKKEGDRLNEGDLLAEIETDKATMGFETPEEGYLAKIMIAGGTKDVPIGKVVCIIVENEEDIAAFKDYTGSDEVVISKPAAAAASPPPPAAATPSVSKPAQHQPAVQPTESSASSGSRVFASPYARKLAAEKGLDLSLVGKGTGSEGRIRAEDVSNFKVGHVVASTTAATTAAFTSLPLTTTRQENYKQLLEWKKKVPQYYLTVDVKMDNIIKLKDELNLTLSKDGDKLTETEFIIKASALACQAVPEVNSSWQDTHIRRYNTINVNVVYNTDKGVYAPVVAAVEKKGLASINKELNQLKTKALQGSLQSHELEGGTFTINNLGMYRVKHFSQIITSPQACALSIGNVKAVFVPNESNTDGRAVANVMCATLSCDHRVVDGAVGAQWLDVFKKLLEKPQLMLM